MCKVYISAPFRIYTSDMEGREYGILCREDYKVFLEEIERCILNLGLDAVLPHRDEGDWGNTYIQPKEVTEICCKLIQSCDILVVFPGVSRGVHFEVGYATALGKRILVLLEEKEKESTLLEGVACITKMRMFRYKSREEIFSILKTELPQLAI